jgi:cation transport regulator ChaB
MAGLEDGVGRNELAAVLFLQASMNTLDAYSTLNSSPWTAESFGADERRAAALKEYVAHAVAYSSLYGLAAAAIARGKTATWAILGGVTITNIYLVWLYVRASRRGREAGSSSWANG